MKEMKLNYQKLDMIIRVIITVAIVFVAVYYNVFVSGLYYEIDRHKKENGLLTVRIGELRSRIDTIASSNERMKALNVKLVGELEVSKNKNDRLESLLEKIIAPVQDILNFMAGSVDWCGFPGSSKVGLYEKLRSLVMEVEND